MPKKGSMSTLNSGGGVKQNIRVRVGYVSFLLDYRFSHFDTIPVCDREMARWTPGYSICCALHIVLNIHCRVLTFDRIHS